jgi:hypothetical protein
MFSVSLCETPYLIRVEIPYKMSQENDIQVSILQAMSPEKKLNVAMRLYYSARGLKAAWIRQQHKQWSEHEVQLAVREAFINARS